MNIENSNNKIIIDFYNNYSILLNNYSMFFFKNINIYKNIQYNHNLYIRGIYIIKNVATISLAYLDNLNDVFNLCEKAYVYFIEFINQLNITNENPIDLSIKDAIIFAYKKTIFQFENKIHDKKFSNNLLININNIVYIINSFFFLFIKIIFTSFNNKLVNKNNTCSSTLILECNNIYDNSLQELLFTHLKELTFNINKILKKILSFYNKLNNSNEDSKNYLINIIFIINYIENDNIIYNNKEEFMNNIIKLFKKFFKKKSFHLLIKNINEL